MLAHYLTYLLTAAYYYLVLGSYATVAAGIGLMPILAFLGTFLLAGAAAPLAMLQNRIAGYLALIALALLGSWVIGLSALALAEPWPGLLLAIALAIAMLTPGGIALYLAMRAVRRRSIARIALPIPVRYLLAFAPAALTVYLVQVFMTGIAQMGV